MRILAFICFVLLVAGCNYTTTRTNMSSDIDEARAVADSFYTCLAKKDFNGAMAFFDPRAIEATPNAQAFLIDNGFNTGPFISAEYKDGKSNLQTVNGQKKAEYKLLYTTTYKNVTCEEEMTLDGSEGKIRILGYHLTVPDEYIKAQIKQNTQPQ